MLLLPPPRLIQVHHLLYDDYRPRMLVTPLLLIMVLLQQLVPQLVELVPQLLHVGEPVTLRDPPFLLLQCKRNASITTHTGHVVLLAVT